LTWDLRPAFFLTCVKSDLGCFSVVGDSAECSTDALGLFCGRNALFDLDFAEDRDFLIFDCFKVFWNRLYNPRSREDFTAWPKDGQAKPGDMKVLELKAADFPLAIRLNVASGTKQYVLVKTKQDKLLLNKPLENAPNPSR
jgi:hypothetical protein